MGKAISGICIDHIFPLLIRNSFAVDTRSHWVKTDCLLPTFCLTGGIWRRRCIGLCSTHFLGHPSSLWWFSLADSHRIIFMKGQLFSRPWVISTFLSAILSINPPVTAVQMSLFLLSLFVKQNISRWQAFTGTVWSYTCTKHRADFDSSAFFNGCLLPPNSYLWPCQWWYLASKNRNSSPLKKCQ